MPGTARQGTGNPRGGMSPVREIRLVLGDQLNIQHPWFSNPSGPEQDVLYLMGEYRSESTDVLHHVQKVIAFFLAMRAFAEVLRSRGHRVQYWQIDAPDNPHSVTRAVEQALAEHGAQRLQWMLPDAWRLEEELRSLTETLRARGCWVEATDTHHFLTTREDFTRHFQGKKGFIMEGFYRMLRRKHRVLLDAAGGPEGGDWNYDAANRKALPKGHRPPEARIFAHDFEAVEAQLQRAGVATWGRCERWEWPVTRAEGLELLEDFIDRMLPLFGAFQDALSDASPTLYHSRLSFVLNVKLLSPLEVVEAVEAAWRQDPERIPLSSAEGFIRQILGWREYVRGHYWHHMPRYATLNYFQHDAPLPRWYWTGETRMACMRQAVGATRDNAYAHHIQRLMVTGNFALLAGVHPDEVDAWYLGVYIDALEWVEMPNTRGMSQFADGGLVGTKPYVSSANYLKKMGAPCSTCFYRAGERTGDRACPFNSLYWQFHDRHRAQLETNPRIGMVYRLWDRMPASERAAVLERAGQVLGQIHSL